MDIKDKEFLIKVFNAMEINKIIADIEEEEKEKGEENHVKNNHSGLPID